MPAQHSRCNVPHHGRRLSTKPTSNSHHPVASPLLATRNPRLHIVRCGPSWLGVFRKWAGLDVASTLCSDALVTSGCTGDEGAEPMNGADHRRDFRVTQKCSIPTLWPSIKFKPRPLRTKWQRARPNR